MQKNIWLVMIAVASGALFIWPTVAKLFSRGREVGVLQAVQLINRKDAVIVDVRDPGEFKSGHIVRARNIPADRIAEHAKELQKIKGKPLLLVCQTGARSAQTCNGLLKDGFDQTVALAGGMAAWQQAGMPVERDG